MAIEVMQQMQAKSYMVKVDLMDDTREIGDRGTFFTQFFGSRQQAIVFAREQFDRYADDDKTSVVITMGVANLPVVDHNGQPINIR